MQSEMNYPRMDYVNCSFCTLDGFMPVLAYRRQLYSVMQSGCIGCEQLASCVSDLAIQMQLYAPNHLGLRMEIVADSPDGASAAMNAANLPQSPRYDLLDALEEDCLSPEQFHDFCQLCQTIFENINVHLQMKHGMVVVPGDGAPPSTGLTGAEGSPLEQDQNATRLASFFSTTAWNMPDIIDVDGPDSPQPGPSGLCRSKSPMCFVRPDDSDSD